MAPSRQQYKIRLASGRVLGPLDRDRIRKLIRKGHLSGSELGREYPSGEWLPVGQIEAVAELFVQAAQSDKTSVGQEEATVIAEPAVAGTLVLPVQGDVAPTQVLPQSAPRSRPPEPPRSATGALPGAETVHAVSMLTDPSRTQRAENDHGGEDGATEVEPRGTRQEATMVATEAQDTRDLPAVPRGRAPSSAEPIDSLDFNDLPKVQLESESISVLEPVRSPAPAPPTRSERRDYEMPRSESRQKFAKLHEPRVPMSAKDLANQETIVFQGENGPPGRGRRNKRDIGEMIKATLAAILLGMAGYEIMLQEPDKHLVRLPPVRPQLPVYIPGDPKPAEAAALYKNALGYYAVDTVTGYRVAADKLRVAAGVDRENVKPLAMLASSYLNLIDSSNKDEKYFSVISTLIDMTRAKGVDLPETLIADVEFFLTINKAEAAENAIVRYTRSHQNFPPEVYYYLALTFMARGDLISAARNLQMFPDNRIFSPKIFYLRGLIAEKLNDIDSAMRDYQRALKLRRDHAKSHLRLADLLYQHGQLGQAAGHLEFIVNNPQLLAPKDLALGYYLHSQLAQSFQKMDIAIGDLERAVRLDSENHEYLLDLYNLRAKAGESIYSLRKEARMWFYLSEGEKRLTEGKVHEALTQFLLAREQNDRSPIPLVKIGDMFRNLHDLGNARLNYKMATDRSSQSIDVWSKYIDVLIQSYEWAEAQAAMDRFRKLPVQQSAIDKAAGDLYSKQGLYEQAEVYYRKAMARDVIDQGVYIAYAKTLLAEGKFKDAPFFFALALRFDPLNTDAVIGTAKCIAGSESIERGIRMLQDELQTRQGARAELLAAIAEMMIQKGDWDQAQKFVNDAISADVEYAYPWKLQGKIFLNKEGSDKRALDKALDAFKSYSDRNPSDPSGYMERYALYVKRTEYEKASDELSKVFGIYPRYPNLHYYKGLLYSAMQNHKVALEELQLELANNPRSVSAMIAMGKELIVAEQPQQALDYLNKAVAIDPKSAEAKNQAGYANFLLKNYQGAVALYSAALIFDKGNSQIYKRLAMAYRELGQTTDAFTACRKYVEMEPDAPDRAECERMR